jgi:hypothetical protein
MAATAVAARLRPRPSAPDQGVNWVEETWRLPLDNWGQGRVWRVVTPGISEARLFVRTKIGFCNCFDGIADDTEIDRIGDIDLHGDDFAAAELGAPASLGDLTGRKRLFQTTRKWNGNAQVLSIVAANDCKAVVATLVSAEPIAPATEHAAISLLTSEKIQRWAANR